MQEEKRVLLRWSHGDSHGFELGKPVSASLSQMPRQLCHLTMAARARVRTVTWIYSAPWYPTLSLHPHPQLNFLR